MTPRPVYRRPSATFVADTRMRAHTREARIANAKVKDQLDRNSFEPENRTTIKTEQISRDICDALVPSPLLSSLSTLVFLLRFSEFSPATKCTRVTRDHRTRIRPSKYLQLKRNSAFAHARHV